MLLEKNKIFDEKKNAMRIDNLIFWKFELIWLMSAIVETKKEMSWKEMNEERKKKKKK